MEGERKGLNALGGYAETQAKTEQKIRMRTKWEGSAARVTPVGAAVGSALLLSSLAAGGRAASLSNPISVSFLLRTFCLSSPV